VCAGRGKDLGDGDGRMEGRAGGRWEAGRRLPVSLLHLRLSFSFTAGQGGKGAAGRAAA
jgi:hypothetical protein